MSKPQATRLYIGQCPECEGIALFTSIWVQGKDEMLTVVTCTDCSKEIAAQVSAEQASGQPKWLAALYQKVPDLEPQLGPPYTVTENCTLELNSD